MATIKCSVPKELANVIESECDFLNMPKSEYLRNLAMLDITLKSYRQLLSDIEFLDTQIMMLQEKLGIKTILPETCN